MAQAYDDQFKAKILKEIKSRGLSVYEAAKKYGISSHTVYRWLNSQLQADLEAMTRLVKKLGFAASDQRRILRLLGIDASYLYKQSTDTIRQIKDSAAIQQLKLYHWRR